MVQQKMADQKQRFGIRKLSIGVASVLLGTLFYMQSGTVYADVNPTASAGNDGINVVNENSSTSSSAVGSSTSNSAGSTSSSSSVSSAGDATNSIDTHQVSASPVESATGQANNNAVAAVREQGSSVPTSHVNEGDDKTVKNENSNLDYHPTQVPNSNVALEKSVAGSGSVDSRVAAPFQPVLAMKAETETPVAKPAVDSEAPKRETVDSTWILHYVNQADHKQELKDPTVITMQYERTNTPQSDGTTQYGDWSYVPGSFKQTGTPITVNDSDNPVKQDNVDKNGENFDVFTITAMYPAVTGYGFYNDINGTRLHDNLRNNERQADAMSKDFYAEYDVAKPTQETVTSQWTIHYVNSTDHKQELKDPTVITQQYTRTNTPQSDGTTKYGDWSYVPGSFKLTGTPIAVNGSDNPTKEDNVDKDGKNEDVFSIIVKHPTITGYEFHNGINGVRLSDYLLNNESNGEIQAPTMSKDGYVEYDVAKERSVVVKFVDDQFMKQQVGQAITVTGRDGDTVNLNLTVPDKYQLADGQQLPTTYSFTNGSGDLKIHLVHKVVQRAATIDVKLLLTTFVDFGNNSYEPVVVTQSRWAQLKEEAKDGPVSPNAMVPVTEVGTLTGHVGYDLVDEEVVSFGDDWTSLNLDGQTYQLPNGTDVVNGILIDSEDTVGKKLKEYYLNGYQNWDSNKHVDPDYVNRPWHGYLSVNATNSTQTPGSEAAIRLGLQAGLAGDEPNTLAKAIGDRAATAVEMANKTIDVSWLQDNLNFRESDFSEHNGQLQAKTGWPAFGVYIPYVEKTATRTINVTTPDGKTTAVEQTATLAKQVDFGKDAHPAWTTGEWTSYDAPSIPGYTASQSQIAKTAVTGETEDQTVNITYTANPQTTTVVYQSEDGTPVHTTTVNGKTGQTVKVPNEVPTGWHLVNGKVPSEITFDPNGASKTVITITHSHATVTPYAPKTTSDKLPDNPGKTYPAGVGHDDLNKTITGTIKVNMPDGQVKTAVKTAHLTRTADVDEVTGEVKYSDWTTGYWSDYTAPSVPGYTANYPYIAGQSVTDMTQDQTIEINYTANPQTTHINYVDGNGKVVHTTTVNGKTNHTVGVPNELPTGWKLVDSQTVPSTITFGANGHADVSVKIEHRHTTVTPDKPQTNSTKLPDNPAQSFHGVEVNDLNKTITRIIKVTTPDGQTKTVAQTAKLTRTATVDEVTGEVTYGNWTTGEWTAYDVPSVAGYTPSQVKVNKETVTADSKDTAIAITYTPNQHQISVEYVDDDDHGKIVKTDQVPGKTDQTITITPSALTNYELVDNGNRTYTVTSADGQAVQIHVKHHQVKTNESKTVTRTINVHTPHDGTKVVKQTADLNRDVTTDQVTGDKTYGDWTTDQWETYTPKAIPGYTPSINDVPSANVDSSLSDQTVNVTYTADAQKVEIVYVDDAKGGAVVKTDQIAGKTDETVKVTPNVPTGYSVVGEVPGSYAMTGDGHQVITVHLVHQMKTASESKSATRTINVRTPHDGTTVFKQTVDLSRDVTTDQVTGDKTYGDWSTTEWTHYDVPVVAGYTPSIKQVAQQVVDGTTTDQTVNVTYTANAQTTHVNYVDGDGNVVHTTTITGKTDQTVKVSNETPAGWKIVGESVPTEITFGPDGHADVTVAVDHQHVTVTPDDPKTPADKLPNNLGKTYPDGVGHDDLNRTVTRTIKVVTPDRQTKTVAQKVQLTRTADIDEVTGKVTYGKWTTGEWSRYEVPSVPGYTAIQSEVPAVNVTDTTKDQMLTLTYTANDQTTHVNYVDGNGKTVHVTTITGKTDQTVKVPNEVPTGWTITDGQVPAEITFGPDGHADVAVTVGHQHVTVTPDQPKTPSDKLPNNPGKTYPAGVGHDDLNKTITRTIKVTTPDGKTQTTVQKVQLTRTADVDEVTGKVTYGKWTTGEWANYTAPAVPGYTASQSDVPATKVTSDTKNQTVTVTYTANAQTTTINYVDGDGKVVHTTTVTGNTDQTVKVPNETPAGWTIADGQVPTEITFGSNGHDNVTVTVGHKHVAVTPDKPQTDGTKLPDNSSQTFHGVGHDDLNKTIVRTIEVTVPTGKTKTVKQTVKLTRSADVDEVTGEVTYGKWATSTWSSYNVPAVPGYTPSQAVVDEVAVNADMANQTVKITYTANDQTTHINYVDENGEAVHTTTIKGRTDQTVKVPNETPAGWTITAGQVPSEVTFGADGHADVKITVDHRHTTVTPDDPKTNGTKLPDNPALTFNGVEHDDLNRTVTRTIKVTTPDGKTQTVAQKVQLTRSADVDEATGEVTYGDWSTGAWSSYTVPTVPGYTASQVTVPATKVTAETADQTVAITYTANDQTTHINYVDENGDVVRTTTITGKTDQTVKVLNEVPTGWTITDGQVPSEVIFGANGYDDVTVTVDHQHVTVTPDKAKTNGTQLPDNSSKTFHGVAETDLNKVVKRTIEVVSPAQKTTTVKQTAKLTRTADVDEVTGEVTYGKWTTGTWSSYTVPTVAGYTPSQAVVTEVAVDANTSDQTVKITYTADSHTTHINYVDKDGNVVHATTVAGTTDQTVKVPNEVPTGWKVTGESVPIELTFGPDGHADVEVTVDHLHVTVTPDQPRENDTKLPNTISKATQSTQTASQNISIRTSQTSTPQTTNDVHESQLPQATNDDHESQLPQTGNKSDSKLELIGLIGIAFAGLFGFGTRRKKRD